MSNLDLIGSFPQPNDSTMIYECHAVCIFVGNDKAGHYIAYTRQDDGFWYNFNDDKVIKFQNTPIVASKQVYVLVYTRQALDRKIVR